MLWRRALIGDETTDIRQPSTNRTIQPIIGHTEQPPLTSHQWSHHLRISACLFKRPVRLYRPLKTQQPQSYLFKTTTSSPVCTDNTASSASTANQQDCGCYLYLASSNHSHTTTIIASIQASPVYPFGILFKYYKTEQNTATNYHTYQPTPHSSPISNTLVANRLINA